jgi:hypothetical protein
MAGSTTNTMCEAGFGGTAVPPKGRRREDDDRQISRWKECVRETGRWRRALLRKYVDAGIYGQSTLRARRKLGA